MPLIQNLQKIRNKKTSDALECLTAGLASARPDTFLAKFVKHNKLTGAGTLRPSDYHKVYIISVGKAADTMAKFVHRKINSDGGVVVIPQNQTSVLVNKKFRTIRASHPVPSNKSVTAAKSVIHLLENMSEDDLAVFLISGGASSLVCMPDGISLKEKQRLTQILLRCGAPIQEINALRKHLSMIKGGRILQHMRCKAISYVLSDVVGDDLSSIASGFTYCDKTTFLDCLKIVKKYHLEAQLPKRALRHLKLGAQGKIPETPKVPKIKNILVASNRDCVNAMAKKARKLGYGTATLPCLTGDVRAAAARILQRFTDKPKSCLVFGGETTLRVTGSGNGGRNQELVLQILKRSKSGTVIASIGTDGIDGNTKHAGAIFHSVEKNSGIDAYLKNNDSNSFFKKNGGLVLTGSTHTNLLDIGLILRS